MRCVKKVGFCVVAGLLATILCAPLNAQSAAKHVILVSIDGMRPIEYTDGERQVRIPTLQAMAKAGCVSPGAIGVFPSVTYPTHTTLVTGQLPAVHGIVSNTPLDPLNLTKGGWYYYAEQIKVPTLWEVVKASGGTTAAVSWPVTVGAKVDYLVPEYRLPRAEDDIALLRALSTPGLVQEIEAQLGPLHPEKHDDEWRTKAAAHIFTKYKPTLMLLHVFDLDHEEHFFGPDSAEADAALQRTDALLASLKARVEEAVGRDSVVWIVVSDHGFQKVEKELHLKILLRSLGYLTSGKGTNVESWRVYPRITGGMAAFVAKEPNDREAMETTTRHIQMLAADPQFGIRKIYTKEDLAKLGAFPDAFLALDMALGYTVGSNTEGALVTPSGSTKGTHGFDPENSNMLASLILSGAGVAPCGAMESARLVDVAPTAAALLGARLPEGAGRIRTEALQTSPRAAPHR